MAELTISASVGAPPAPNREADVRTVQTLLQRVTPPLAARVAVTGTMDAATRQAIREFQDQFMDSPDGRVDPGGRTLYHLNNGSAPQYRGCNGQQRRGLDADLMRAQDWLDVVNRRLNSVRDADVKRKLRNVFHIDLDDALQFGRYSLLLLSYVRLRVAMDAPFPLQCEPRSSAFGAWVHMNDPTGTMHFPRNHFSQDVEERTEAIIHERAHTILRVQHAGMVAGGQLDFGRSADDDNGFTYDEAIANAYCYGWLATALQPGYTRAEQGMTITASPSGR